MEFDEAPFATRWHKGKVELLKSAPRVFPKRHGSMAVTFGSGDGIASTGAGFGSVSRRGTAPERRPISRPRREEVSPGCWARGHRRAAAAKRPSFRTTNWQRFGQGSADGRVARRTGTPPIYPKYSSQPETADAPSPSRPMLDRVARLAGHDQVPEGSGSDRRQDGGNLGARVGQVARFAQPRRQIGAKASPRAGSCRGNDIAADCSPQCAARMISTTGGAAKQFE